MLQRFPRALKWRCLSSTHPFHGLCIFSYKYSLFYIKLSLHNKMPFFNLIKTVNQFKGLLLVSVLPLIDLI